VQQFLIIEKAKKISRSILKFCLERWILDNGRGLMIHSDQVFFIGRGKETKIQMVPHQMFIAEFL